jgi:hypothetical protein
MPTDPRILRFYENTVARHDKERAEHKFMQDGLYYLREHVPYRHIVRVLRMQSDIPICFGAFDCLDAAVAKCKNGKHSVCPDHSNTCFLCKAEEEAADK